MIRDTAITALLQRRLYATATTTRDAATVLLGLCGAGMTDFGDRDGARELRASPLT